MCLNDVIDQINTNNCIATFQMLYGTDECTIDKQKKRYVQAIEAFRVYFPSRLDISIFSAPGRTEIGGNHTDHQRGVVLAGAVDLDTIAIVAFHNDKVVRIKSEGYMLSEINLDNLHTDKNDDGTTALVKGVISRFVEKGIVIGGIDMYVTSDVICGGGISSSAAFETLIGTIIDAQYNNSQSSAFEIAQYGWYAENVYFGKKCGLLDQTVSSYGGLVSIDFKNGLDESVSAKVKAERLKTELITNVSHDLKTPITSIINYTELLAKIDDLPEEAKDYVSVIAKKSDRLKRLTQDLFDISKVQSGNDDVVLERLDVALLINQALGEHDSEIQESGLPFCINAPKELYISADGRKMSRVVSNLISNILKYSMKNTRVFITASQKNGTVVMEFKNISAYPLDFDVEEITQRFVRGDESRTTEGNGLGLAIAKSYTEICNGSFEIATDGDLFKAILKFRKYNQ